MAPLWNSPQITQFECVQALTDKPGWFLYYILSLEWCQYHGGIKRLSFLFLKPLAQCLAQVGTQYRLVNESVNELGWGWLGELKEVGNLGYNYGQGKPIWSMEQP